MDTTDSPGQWKISEEKMIATFLEEGIVCRNLRCFIMGIVIKHPLVWTIAVPRNISRTKINIDNFAYKLYFVQNDKLLLGKTTGEFNGIELSVYDRERTICDCFKYN